MSSDVLHNIQWLAVWQPCLACNATSGHSAGLFLQEKQDKEKVHKDRQRTLSLSVNLFRRGTHKLSWGCKKRVLVSSWTDKAFLYPRLCSSVYTVAWWWPGPSAICHGAPCFCPLSVPMFSLDNCACACISSCMCVCVCVSFFALTMSGIWWVGFLCSAFWIDLAPVCGVCVLISVISISPSSLYLRPQNRITH